MQRIDQFTSTVAASLQKQDFATGELSRNVASAADRARVVVSVLDQVAGAVGETRDYVETVLKVSESVATVATKVQENVDSFLRRVAV